MNKNTILKASYNSTIYACFAGYVVQAIINNFLPLLFVMLQTDYDISLSKITLLITFNFGVQLLVDLSSVTFVDRIGYRASVILANICAASGLVLVTILPDLLGNAFAGLLLAVIVYAVGGGLLEVLVSPIVESCPTEHKAQTMSLLHSFYCWGHVGVVLLTTAFLAIFGSQNWKVLAIVWALVPLADALAFARVPFAPMAHEEEGGLTFRQLFSKKVFWVLLLLMLCAGASEQSVIQWASIFAEKGLGVGKAVGDLAGPMMFALMMGVSRTIYGKYGKRMNLRHFMQWSAGLCIGCYLLISFTPFPVLGLIGCGLCGLSVGIMWPGTYSVAASTLKSGGTAMFALLALAGDLGCSLGPTLVGMVSGAFSDRLQIGILAAIIFPVLLLLGMSGYKRIAKSNKMNVNTGGVLK